MKLKSFVIHAVDMQRVRECCFITMDTVCPNQLLMVKSGFSIRFFLLLLLIFPNFVIVIISFVLFSELFLSLTGVMSSELYTVYSPADQ